MRVGVGRRQSFRLLQEKHARPLEALSVRRPEAVDLVSIDHE